MHSAWRRLQGGRDDRAEGGNATAAPAPQPGDSAQVQQAIQSALSNQQLSRGVRDVLQYHVTPGAFMLGAFPANGSGAILLPTALTDPDWVKLGNNRPQVIKIVKGGAQGSLATVSQQHANAHAQSQWSHRAQTELPEWGTGSRHGQPHEQLQLGLIA